MSQLSGDHQVYLLIIIDIPDCGQININYHIE